MSPVPEPLGAARLRAKLAELRIRLTAGDDDDASEQHARELDALEVGRRADRRRAERDAATAPETSQPANEDPGR